jgi:hypothetical protein
MSKFTGTCCMCYQAKTGVLYLQPSIQNICIYITRYTKWCCMYNHVHIQSGAVCITRYTKRCCIYYQVYKVVLYVLPGIQSGAVCITRYTKWCCVYWLIRKAICCEEWPDALLRSFGIFPHIHILHNIETKIRGLRPYSYFFRLFLY